jgi:hypothetical protein
MFNKLSFQLLAICLFVIECCTRQPTLPVEPPLTALDSESAVVFVLDDSDYGMGDYLQQMTNQDSDLINFIDSMASEIIEEPRSTFDTMSLHDIIGFGFDKMATVAIKHYSKVLVLKGEKLDVQLFLDTLQCISDEGFLIDLIFCLHGSNNTLVLGHNDTRHSVAIRELTDVLRFGYINVRMLYQTCCSGESMIDEWENTGICAVNGAHAINYTLTGPYTFFMHWINNVPYSNCVMQGFNADSTIIAGIRSLSPQLQTLFPLKDLLDGSRQGVGGSSPELTIDLQCGETKG